MPDKLSQHVNATACNKVILMYGICRTGYSINKHEANREFAVVYVLNELSILHIQARPDFANPDSL